MKNALLAPQIVVALLLSSCSISDPISTDLTLTAKDPAHTFTPAITYALADTVQPVGSTTTIDPTLSSFVLSQVASHFDAIGYTRLTDSTGPDPAVFVQVSAMQTTSTDVYYSTWSSYWGTYYDPWYGASYTAGYAPYSYPIVVESTLGTLVVNMTDPTNRNTTDQKIPSLWVAVLNGALDGSSTANIQSRIQNGLDEAFAQSPYLKGGS